MFQVVCGALLCILSLGGSTFSYAMMHEDPAGLGPDNERPYAALPPEALVLDEAAENGILLPDSNSTLAQQLLGLAEKRPELVKVLYKKVVDITGLDREDAELTEKRIADLNDYFHNMILRLADTVGTNLKSKAGNTIAQQVDAFFLNQLKGRIPGVRLANHAGRLFQRALQSSDSVGNGPIVQTVQNRLNPLIEKGRATAENFLPVGSVDLIEGAGNCAVRGACYVLDAAGLATRWLGYQVADMGARSFVAVLTDANGVDLGRIFFKTLVKIRNTIEDEHFQTALLDKWGTSFRENQSRLQSLEDEAKIQNEEAQRRQRNLDTLTYENENQMDLRTSLASRIASLNESERILSEEEKEALDRIKRARSNLSRFTGLVLRRDSGLNASELNLEQWQVELQNLITQTRQRLEKLDGFISASSENRELLAIKEALDRTRRSLEQVNQNQAHLERQISQIQRNEFFRVRVNGEMQESLPRDQQIGFSRYDQMIRFMVRWNLRAFSQISGASRIHAATCALVGAQNQNLIDYFAADIPRCLDLAQEQMVDLQGASLSIQDAVRAPSWGTGLNALRDVVATGLNTKARDEEVRQLVSQSSPVIACTRLVRVREACRQTASDIAFGLASMYVLSYLSPWIDSEYDTPIIRTGIVLSGALGYNAIRSPNEFGVILRTAWSFCRPNLIGSGRP